jgi:hypothetical protein
MALSNTSIQQNNPAINPHLLPTHLQDKVREAISLIDQVSEVNAQEGLLLTKRLQKILGRDVQN